MDAVERGEVASLREVDELYVLARRVLLDALDALGLHCNASVLVGADFYPSPGGSSEIIYLYYAEVPGKFAVPGKTGGLAGHGEDIVTLEVTLEEAMEMIKIGTLIDAKSVAATYWLENRFLKQKQ